MSDFDTEFKTMFEPALEPVAIERNPSAATFARYRRAGLPVIVEGVVSEWPAFTRWRNADHLCERAGAERVFARNLAKSSSSYQDYREAYEETSFADFVRAVYGDPDAGLYLTQGAIRRPHGWRAAFERGAHPALLTALADDLRDPPHFAPEDLYEANLWLGPGRHESGLHFDEYDNLNCAILGEKRWLLFPQREHARLVGTSGGYAGSIAVGFHAAETERFAAPERRRARGYECVTRPGQMLYVPAGWWHQVFSGPRVNLAVNYWYLPARDALRTLGLVARRRAGYGSAAKHAAVSAVVTAIAAKRLLNYARLEFLGRWPDAPPVGPTGYDMRAL